MAGFGLQWSQPFPPQTGILGSASVDWAAINEESNAQIVFENEPGQNRTPQGPVCGSQGELFFNNVPCQYQYAPDTGPTPDVKPRVQLDVRATAPLFLAECRNKFADQLRKPDADG
jgi:hypothetical protein